MYKDLVRTAVTITMILYTASLMADQALRLTCPDSPNCVSSHATTTRHYIEPIKAGQSSKQALTSLSQALSELPRVTWSTNGPRHIRAEFTSAVFGFTDDVDFLIEDNGLIQVRSASRTGYWDFGVNRRRVEHFRERLTPHEK